VDLVFREGDELVVVDYKTDSVDGDDFEAWAQEHHSGQADVYARALSGATGLSVREVVFVFCRAGVEVVLRP
jgi:ATP-dependent exoDNAse (exonuclease V) beta subunit